MRCLGFGIMLLLYCSTLRVLSSFMSIYYLHRYSIRRNRIPNQNWGCFVRHLKTIIIVLKIISASWSKLSEKLKNCIKVSAGKAVFDLLIKTCKILQELMSFWQQNIDVTCNSRIQGVLHNSPLEMGYWV